MIKISVDEALAYDMLAILVVKQRAKSSVEGALAQTRLEQELGASIGMAQHEAVMWSSEFAQLIDINQTIFNTLDEMKAGSEAMVWNAAYVDKLNYKRWLAKRDLQRRFFPESDLTERKIGYDKEV